VKLSLHLLVVLLVSACAGGPFGEAGTFLPPKHREALQAAKVCCASYRDIQYAKLQRGVETKIVVSTESPVFEFDGRRGFFAAFELPPGANRVLVVTTVPVNMLWNRTGHVMIPAVLFLDDSYQPYRNIYPPYQTDSQPFRGSWAQGQVEVPKDARYVILLEGPAGGLAWRDRDQASGSLFVRGGPTGEIGVSLFGT